MEESYTSAASKEHTKAYRAHMKKTLLRREKTKVRVLYSYMYMYVFAFNTSCSLTLLRFDPLLSGSLAVDFHREVSD